MESENKNECFNIVAVCSFFCMLLVLIAVSITYIVYGIMYLIQDYDIAHECTNSSLWAYVLTSVIISLLRFCGKNNKENKNIESNICIIICLGLIELAFSIWGGVELFQKSCNNLYETNLWTFALITFILQIIAAFICLIVVPCTILCCIVNNNVEKSNENNNENYNNNKEWEDLNL